MAEKNRTPDILGSVLNAPTSATSAPLDAKAPVQPKATAARQTSKQQEGKTVRHNTIRTEKQQNGKMVNEQDSLPQAQDEKVKATFYLAPSAVEGLEEAWLQLRRQARGGHRRRAISKSAIVEAALQLMLEDLDTHGESSQISGKLLDA